MEILNIKLDKITVVGNLNTELAFALEHATNEPHVLIKGTPTIGYIEGQFFFYGDYEPVYYKYDSVNSESMGKRNFRMEFNPSKITLEQSEWLKDKIIYILDSISVTRADFAFDCDFDLSKFDYEFKSTLSGNKWWGQDQKTQTLYYGSRNSDFYYRIYNKKLEQEKEIEKQKKKIEKRKLKKMSLEETLLVEDIKPLLYDAECWWRYEIEVKNADTIDNLIQDNLPLFSDKRIIIHDINTLKGNDAVMVTGLLANSELWKEIHPNSRTKYRKIIKSLGGNDITPLFIGKLNEKKPELIREINSWRGLKY